MLELMRAVRADYVNVPTFLAGLTLTAAAAGDVAFAGSLLDDQAAAGFDSIRHDAEWLPVVGFLASACAMAGVNRHAEALHALLATSPATTVRVGPLAGWWGPIALHLGALCRLLGDLDQAERHLVVALDVAGTLGSPPFEARTEVELAALLDQRGAASTRGARPRCAKPPRPRPASSLRQGWWLPSRGEPRFRRRTSALALRLRHAAQAQRTETVSADGCQAPLHPQVLGFESQAAHTRGRTRRSRRSGSPASSGVVRETVPL